MSLQLLARPICRDGDASVDTDGVAYDIRNTSTTASRPIRTRQVKVYVGAAAYIGWGTSSTPPAAAATNTVYQEAETEEVYTFAGNDAQEKYLYVYAQASTIAARVSVFG